MIFGMTATANDNRTDDENVRDYAYVKNYMLQAIEHFKDCKNHLG